MKIGQKGENIFFRGFLSGFGIAVFAIIITFYIIANRGLVVTLKTDQLAGYIGNEVENQLAQELPKVMANAKALVPALIKEQMQTGKLKAEIKISNVINITLPPSALAQLDAYLQSVVQTTVYSLLDGINLEEMAKELGRKADIVVRESIIREIGNSKALSIKTKWGVLPVVLKMEDSNTPGAQTSQ